MRLALLAVPYDSGRRSVGVGLGPARLLEAGIANHLREAGHDVRESTVELPHDVTKHEMARTVAIQRELGRAVREAVAAGELPIVLAGNCSTAVGTLAARPEASAVVWFDAHADFNTADTTITGMLDGLALSMVTGRALQAMTGSVQGFIPVRAEDVILVGARDLDPAEVAALDGSPVARVSTADAPGKIAAVLRSKGRPVPPVYVHIDLDVLDARQARANQYDPPGGLSPDALVRTLGELIAVAPLHAVALTAYDPSWDANGRTLRVAFDALTALLPRPDGGD
jgi:arginase